MIREHIPFNEERAMWFVPFVSQFEDGDKNISSFWFKGYLFVHHTNVGGYNQYFRLVFPIDRSNKKDTRIRVLNDLEREMHKHLDGKEKDVQLVTIIEGNHIYYSFVKLIREQDDEKGQRGYRISIDSID